MPQVSVIMPCFNHARFVSESVMSILGQTFKDLELIVVDDKSKDDSVNILRKLAIEDSRLKLIVHDRNQGASSSRNSGLQAARGEFVAFCDADDLWKSCKLQRQIQELTMHSDCDIAYCGAELINETGQPTGEFFTKEFPLPKPPSGDLFEVLCARNFINMSTVLARRQSLGERLLFDESIQYVEDWWQWIRLSRHHRFLYAQDALVKYRVHPQSTGRTQKPRISRNRWKVYKRNLQTHNDMPLQLQAMIWQQMGINMCGSGKRRQGCRFLWQAVRSGLKGGLSLSWLVKTSARLGVEWGWRGMLRCRTGIISLIRIFSIFLERWMPKKERTANEA
jgi:glycosyltransferase involved in cell wall biosynthesis